AGLAAATMCARAGKSTLLVDDQLRPGGSLRTEPSVSDVSGPGSGHGSSGPGSGHGSSGPGSGHGSSGVSGSPTSGRELADVRGADAIAAGVELMSRATAIGFFPEDDGGVLAVAAPDHLVRVHARTWIWATGGYVVNLPF